MKIIVIDNDTEWTNPLVDLLSQAFPGHIVLPAEGQTFTEWTEVRDYIKAIPDDIAILCLDLALEDKETPDSLRGLQHGQLIRTDKPQWVLIAYTRFGVRVKREPAFKEAFDGLMDKGDLDPLISRPERLAYVKRAIDAATTSRKEARQEDILEGLKIIDSLGMRTFRAAFSDRTIKEIIEAETSGWQQIRLEALTTGHSGAFMLSINGTSKKGQHSLVIKVAKTPNVIKNETEAQIENLDNLGVLTGYVTPLDSDKKELTFDTGVYYRQARVEGQPLLELLRTGHWSRHKKLLRPVADLCIRVNKSAQFSEESSDFLRNKFKLAAIDISRLETSLTFLVSLGNTIRRRDFWPLATVPAARIAADLKKLANTWTETLCGDLKTWNITQHGDLNPNNIMILRDHSPRFIDLARLGSWPIGYDLSRLALMLRLRLTDSSGNQDWLHDSLERWYSEPVALIDQQIDVESALCPEAVYCDQQFRTFLQESPESYRDLLAFGYKLGTLWDLIKIVSYQDISPFKRVWTFLESWRLMHTLASCKRKLPTSLPHTP